MKIIPGDSSSKIANVTIEDSSTVHSVAVLEVPKPRLFSPPRIVRVTGASLFKSADVIDLTKPISQETNNKKTKGYECPPSSPTGNSSVNAAKDDTGDEGSPAKEPPQNQLGDKRARRLYDAVWLGKPHWLVKHEITLLPCVCYSVFC